MCGAVFLTILWNKVDSLIRTHFPILCYISKQNIHNKDTPALFCFKRAKLKNRGSCIEFLKVSFTNRNFP